MTQILKPRIRPLFQQAYREVKYVLEEDEYNEADVEEVFVKRFRSGFDKLISVYRQTMTEANFNQLMALVLDALTAQWERIISQTRFNQYGALRFDKDLRAVIQYLSGLTDWLYSRDRFTRLNQMATLLNFEEVCISLSFSVFSMLRSFSLFLLCYNSHQKSMIIGAPRQDQSVGVSAYQKSKRSLH